MEPESPRRTKVFVSYSSKDRDLIEPLRTHLSGGLGRGVAWIDKQEIAAGETWHEEIQRGLAETRVALLIISANFDNSDYIQETELRYLREAAQAGQVTLLPIFLREFDYPREIRNLNGINQPDKPVDRMAEADRNGVWTHAVRRIKELLADLIVVTVAKEDRDAAERLLAPLEKKGLAFDVEEYELENEQGLQRRLTTKLAQRKAALLVFGRRGLGLWKEPDMKRALADAQSEGRRVISVLLPGRPADFKPPIELSRNTCLNLGEALGDSEIGWLLMGLAGRIAEPPSVPVVNPPDPSPPAVAPPELAEKPEPSSELLAALAERLAFENLTIFLGSEVAGHDAAETENDEKPPARLYELARGLLEDLDLAGTSGERMILPLDVAGTYFAVRKGERSLESRLCDMVNERRLLTPTHRALAQMLRTLTDLEAADRFARRGQRPARLVVTTNVDLLTERALLLAGVPFVRLVQDRSGEKIVVNVYEKIEARGDDLLVVESGGEQRTVQRGDADMLSEVIGELGREELVYRGGNAQERAEALQNPLRTLALERYSPQVYLYKFHGSEDVRNSCAISIDQHLRLIKAVLAKNVVPLKITEYLSSGPALVLGYGLLDPPFRVLLHTLPLEGGADPAAAVRHYLVQMPPQTDDPDDFRRLEQQLWPKIKELARRYGLEVLEQQGDVFLDQLNRALSARWSA